MLKPFVATNCGFDQSEADDLVAKSVDIIQSHFPDWDSQKCPTASHVLSQRQKTEAGSIEGEADRGVDVESEEDDLVDSKLSHRTNFPPWLCTHNSNCTDRVN